MSELNLNSFVAVPIPLALYNELVIRSPEGVSTLLEHVVWDFLDRTADDFSVDLNDGSVNWDGLYLPDGTEIRTKYFNEYKVANIRNSKIFWKDKEFASFSQLARTMRGNTSNNAWKMLEIKRPFDKVWQLADRLRRK